MRRLLLVIVGLGLLAVAGVWARANRLTTPPLLRPLVFPAGDGGEYFHVLQAWWDHGSPDVRPEDSEQLAALARARGLDDAFVPLTAGIYFQPTDAGLRFGYHFWLYPLCAVPAKALLWAVGRNELAALLVTNVLLFALAVGVVLTDRTRPWGRRLLLAGLAAVGPVIWYLRWPGPEVFTWALVLVSLSLLGRGLYIPAALCAALGATQNPPVVALAGVIFLLSLRERRPWLAAGTAAAASIAFVPYLFALIYYGRLSLQADHFCSLGYISPAKTWSLLTDLNQGLLPHLPGLTLLAVAALVQVIRTRSLSGLAVLTALAGMSVGVQVHDNWNNGAAQMMRYLTWMIPLLAWLAAEYLPLTRPVYAVAAAAVGLHAAIVPLHDGSMVFVEQTRLASYVLARWPTLYDPLPEIFAERQLGFDAVCQNDRLAGYLPVAFSTADGRVTKVLLDDATLPLLPAAFEAEPGYLEEVAEAARRRRGLFYLTPPPGRLRLRREPNGDEMRAGLVHVELLRVPERVAAPVAHLDALVTNATPAMCWTKWAPGRRPLHVCYHVTRNGTMLVFDGERSPLPGSLLGPGESRRTTVKVALPAAPGEYVVEVLPVVELVGWGSEPQRVRVVVQASQGGGYAAELTPLGARDAADSRGPPSP